MGESNTPETQAHPIDALRQMVADDIKRNGDFSSFMIRNGKLADLLDELQRHRQSSSNAGGVETLESIVAWGDETFGPCSQDRAIERAWEEWQEMLEKGADVPIEAADVIICLLRIPGILDAINRKMTINRGRTWDVRPDGTGYHVKTAALASLSTPTAEPTGEGDPLHDLRRSVAEKQAARERDNPPVYADPSDPRFAVGSTTPPTPDRIGKDAVREALEDDNEWVCAGIPDEAIEAGIAAWRAADVAMLARDESEHPEDMADWDEGMIVCAIFKAVGRALSATPAQEGLKLCSFCPNPATGWANGESDMMPACDGCQSQHEHHPGFLSFAEKTELEVDADANRKLPTRPPAQPVDETERLHDLLHESLYHLRLDDGAKAFHEKVMALLKARRPQHKGEVSRG